MHITDNRAIRNTDASVSKVSGTNEISPDGVECEQNNLNGFVVLPKELREKANIRAGDKLAVTTWEKDGKVCCISLIKVEELTDMVRAMLGPVMRDTL